jgi:hypothetical protein
MGGGARGFYEAGVVYAFHLCQMEFEVIAGSSAGALNAILYAEYLHRRGQVGRGQGWLKVDGLPDRQLKLHGLAGVAAMEDFMGAVLYSWLTIAEVGFFDDSSKGRLGRIYKDIATTWISLGMVLRLGWRELISRKEPWNGRFWQRWLGYLGLLWLGRGPGWLVRLIKKIRSGSVAIPKTVVDEYLQSWGIEQALTTPEGLANFATAFSRKSAPILREARVKDGLHLQIDPDKTIDLVDEDRRLGDYRESGLDVRLTRTNYRTGLLEVSAYISPVEFYWYTRQFFQLQQDITQDAFPFRKHRLYIPGNPLVIGAALASARLPVVFPPLPFAEVYGNKRDALDAYRFADKKFQQPALIKDLDTINQQFLDLLDGGRRTTADANWKGVKTWLTAPINSRDRKKDSIRKKNRKRFESYFPGESDLYFDGGAIDNAPGKNVLDALYAQLFRERLTGSGTTSLNRDVQLDLYMVMLEELPEQRESPSDQPPTLFDVADRAIKLLGNAAMTAEANFPEYITEPANEGHKLAEGLLLLLEAAKTDPQLGQALNAALFDTFNAYFYDRRGKEKRSSAGIPYALREVFKETGTKTKAKKNTALLERLEEVAREALEENLAIQTETVIIDPDEMVLSLVSFTEVMGYTDLKGVEHIAQGCYNTLWKMRVHLESKTRRALDESPVDRRALQLVREWVGLGGEPWPKTTVPDRGAIIAGFRESWQCPREECPLYAHCAHGAVKG